MGAILGVNIKVGGIIQHEKEGIGKCILSANRAISTLARLYDELDCAIRELVSPLTLPQSPGDAAAARALIGTIMGSIRDANEEMAHRCVEIGFHQNELARGINRIGVVNHGETEPGMEGVGT